MHTSDKNQPSERVTGFENLSDEELIERVQQHWVLAEVASRTVLDLLDQKPAFLQNIIRERTVCDLGCGWRGLHMFGPKLIHMGAEAYVGIDLTNFYNENESSYEGKPMFFHECDALTYLRRQRDNSVVVMANALFDEPISPNRVDEACVENMKIEYLRRLIREMYRVTPDICFGVSMGAKAKSLACRTGFEVHSYTQYQNTNDRIIFQNGAAQPVDIGTAKFEDFYILYKPPVLVSAEIVTVEQNRVKAICAQTIGGE